MEQETLTVKFDGQQHQVDLQTFANSVLNFASVLKEANRKLGGDSIKIEIKAPEKGSLLVDIVTTITSTTTSIFSQNNTAYVASLIEVVGGLYGVHKFITGRSVKEIKKEDNSIKIKLEDNSEMTVAENVYNIYINTPSIPTSISQNFSALDNDPAVSKFEVLTNKNTKIIEVDKEDYARLSIKQQFETENSKKIIESADLLVYKIVFDKTDRKWEFLYRGNRISANISDENFYKLIDGGESFAKGDMLKVDLQINQVLDETIGAYVNQSYQIMKVIEHIKRKEPQTLPFNKTLE